MPNEQQSGKMWSGRFREPLDRQFESWQRSLPFDWRLLPQEIAASKAHASALAAAGILTKDELAEFHAALDAIAAKHASDAGKALVRDHPTAEDIHHFVELSLVERIGALGLKLHTGRSRNEQIATDLRLFVREQIDEIIKALAKWAEALLEQARNAGDAVMPSYTHLQRAEPVLVAHWLLANVEMILRDAGRLREGVVLPMPVDLVGAQTCCAHLSSRIPAIGHQPRQPRRQLEQRRRQLPFRQPQQERPGQPQEQPGLPPRPQLMPGGPEGPPD